MASGAATVDSAGSGPTMSQFYAPTDGSLSGHNVVIDGHPFATQADVAACANLCVSRMIVAHLPSNRSRLSQTRRLCRCLQYAEACLSFDFCASNLRCYIGSARAGDDSTAVIHPSGATARYQYFEKKRSLVVAGGPPPPPVLSPPPTLPPPLTLPPPGSLPTPCLDSPPRWQDVLQRGCPWFGAAAGACGALGPTSLDSSGVSATRACCICGGGLSMPQLPTMPPAAPPPPPPIVDPW